MKTICPSESDLRDLIDEKIQDQSISVRLQQHLETCVACQLKLDGWLATSSLVCGWDAPDETTLMTFDGHTEATIERLIGQIVSRGPDAPSTLGIGQTLGKYQLLEQVGVGSSSVVYLALDVVLERHVAIKILKPDDTESDRAIQRLQREARAASSISHPNVVEVLDVCIRPDDFESDSPSYLVMEFIKGDTLSQYVAKRKSIDSHVAAKLVQQILQGLSSAHEKGLVHRDLKSSNVLIESSNRNQCAKITDFGLVRDLETDSDLTRENVIAGTPAYMSPEQITRPHDVDHRADIYSVGVVMYEMLSGELPFRGTNRMVLKQAIRDRPQPMRLRNESIGRGIEAICFKAMSKNPNGRYQSAMDMFDDLERWVAGKRVNAHPGPVQTTMSWGYSNWKTALSFCLSAIVLVAATVLFSRNWAPVEPVAILPKSQNSFFDHQRDATLDTIRELVFASTLLSKSKTAPQALNESVLTEALLKIEALDKAQLKSGFVDASWLATKNQLGDICFLLERYDNAVKHYEGALSRASQFNDGNKDVRFFQQRLRTFEGLASIELTFEDDGLTGKWSKQAELTAEKIRSAGGAATRPKYFVGHDHVLEVTKVQSLLEKLAKAITVEPSEISQIKSTAKMTRALGEHFIQIEQLQDAEDCFNQLLDWLDSGQVGKEKGEVLRTWRTARHVGLKGLSQVAEARFDTDSSIEFLRDSINALPWGRHEHRFHFTARKQAFDGLEKLLRAIDHETPKRWMHDYYRLFSELEEKGSENHSSSTLVSNLNYCEIQAKHIRLLAQSGKEKEAVKTWKSFSKRLSQLEIDSVPAKYQRPLRIELSRLAKLGYKLDK